MLDDYQLLQPIVYKILKNSLKNKRNLHAYLFETRDYAKGLEMAMAFSKYLLCPKNYSNNSKCGSCTQCHTIEMNNYIEIKIINPDGMWIKKEQLTALQQEFSKKAINGDKKIYIINGAEKLNASAANSILKFLEEPEDNIIAILISNNQYQLLDTIVSRCQVVSFIENQKNQSDNFIENVQNYLLMSDEEKETFNLDKIESVIKFIDFYEANKKDTILHLNRLWHKNINNRKVIEIAFEIVTLYYKDVLNYLCNRKLENFNNYLKQIEVIANKNTRESICNKIKITLEMKDKIKFNMNNSLLMDKFIIMLERGL